MEGGWYIAIQAETQDPATGIQPFLPPVAPSNTPPVFKAALSPFAFIHAVVRSALLLVVALLYFVLDKLTLVFVRDPMCNSL